MNKIKEFFEQARANGNGRAGDFEGWQKPAATKVNFSKSQIVLSVIINESLLLVLPLDQSSRTERKEALVTDQYFFCGSRNAILEAI